MVFAWRHRREPTLRALPVVLHLFLAAGMALFLLWRYQENMAISEHLRPELAFGAYVTALGVAGAVLGSFIGLKNVR